MALGFSTWVDCMKAITTSCAQNRHLYLIRSGGGDPQLDLFIGYS